MTLHLQEHQPNSRENEVSEEMDEVSPRPRRIVHPINRLTYDRLGGVLKELSEAGIVSEYGAYTATNFPVFVCLRWRMLSLFMMICSTRTFLFFLTRLCMLLMLWNGASLCSYGQRRRPILPWYQMGIQEDDLPVKWRFRLVLRGFQQKSTEDYFETFLYVLRKESLRLFFALCVRFDYVCNQTDVNIAF